MQIWNQNAICMKLLNIYQNILILKYGFSILLGKVDIKTKTISGKEEGHFNIMKKLIHQKFIEFLHEYVPN